MRSSRKTKHCGGSHKSRIQHLRALRTRTQPRSFGSCYGTWRSILIQCLDDRFKVALQLSHGIGAIGTDHHQRAATLGNGFLYLG